MMFALDVEVALKRTGLSMSAKDEQDITAAKRNALLVSRASAEMSWSVLASIEF
jgi:hypothetical protein